MARRNSWVPGTPPTHPQHKLHPTRPKQRQLRKIQNSQIILILQGAVYFQGVIRFFVIYRGETIFGDPFWQQTHAERESRGQR